jgi:hypothetical protein
MTAFDLWIAQATCHLSRDSAAQVRREIFEHYEQERETAVSRGASAEEADRSAVASLGSPTVASRQYRKVLLTPDEERMLKEGNQEARAICSRWWLKWTMLGAPVVTLLASLVLFSIGKVELSRDVVLLAVAIGIFFAAPFLPIYTPTRSRIYRVVKWAVLIAVLSLVLGRHTLRYSWLMASCIWIPIWTEWTRFCIRRKLPIADWPRQLYL